MTLVTTAIAARYARARHLIAVLTALAIAVGALLVITLPVFAAFGASVVAAIAWCMWLERDEAFADPRTSH